MRTYAPAVSHHQNKQKWQHVCVQCVCAFSFTHKRRTGFFGRDFEVLFDSRREKNAKTAYIWSSFFFPSLYSVRLPRIVLCFSCLVSDDLGRAETAGSRPRQPNYRHVGTPRESKPYTTYLGLGIRVNMLHFCSKCIRTYVHI